MDNEMIARVVKALDDAWPDGHKEAALKVIKAMREPTERQLIAAFNKIQVSSSHAREIYTVMLDSITND